MQPTLCSTLTPDFNVQLWATLTQSSIFTGADSESRLTKSMSLQKSTAERNQALGHGIPTNDVLGRSSNSGPSPDAASAFQAQLPDTSSTS